MPAFKESIQPIQDADFPVIRSRVYPNGNPEKGHGNLVAGGILAVTTLILLFVGRPWFLTWMIVTLLCVGYFLLSSLVNNRVESQEKEVNRGEKLVVEGLLKNKQQTSYKYGDTYTLFVGSEELDVDVSSYTRVDIGDTIQLEMLPKSKLVFRVKKVDSPS